MQIVDVIILGVLQGLTEFLPVSSSGHLVLGQYLLSVKSPGNTLEILFHLGTLGSVIYVFSPDIMNILTTIKEKSTQKDNFGEYFVLRCLATNLENKLDV